MVVPVILGLPWLAGVIGAAFASLVGWLAKFLSEKLAVRVAIVVFFTGLVSAFALAINALASSITLAFPSGIGYLGLFYPTGGTAVMSAVLAARLLRWAFDWKVKAATMYAS